MLEIDWKPDRKKLRQFGLTILVGFSVIGLFLGWKLGSFSGEGSWAVPAIIWSAGFGIGLLGWLVPEAVRPMYLLWMALAFPIGWILSHIFLGIVYWGLFTAVSVLFRIVGRDPLKRKKAAVVDTYWVERSEKVSPSRYFRQF